MSEGHMYTRRFINQGFRISICRSNSHIFVSNWFQFSSRTFSCDLNFLSTFSLLFWKAEEVTLHALTYQSDIWVSLLGLLHQPPLVAPEVVLIVLVVHVRRLRSIYDKRQLKIIKLTMNPKFIHSFYPWPTEITSQRHHDVDDSASTQTEPDWCCSLQLQVRREVVKNKNKTGIHIVDIEVLTRHFVQEAGYIRVWL